VLTVEQLRHRAQWRAASLWCNRAFVLRGHAMGRVAASTPSAPALLRAHDLGFSHPGRELFAGLCFVVGPGLTLLRGGDGRGKTSLLRLIAGELAPSAGVIERTAAAIFHATPADPAHDGVVVRDWLAAQQQRFCGWQAGVAAALIEGFGLAEHVDKPMFMLSTGSRRKVGLVAAAASQAPLTLVDTPYAALDVPSSRLLTRLLAEAAENASRAWVIADYEAPAGLAGLRWSAVVELGD
jgi:ABC-type transport system involved in cytochrome c biogenesis ATPase subunit